MDADPLNYIDPYGLNKYIYGRRGIHHQLPSSVARDMDWSPSAVREFDISGFNPPLRGKPHYKEGGLTHHDYNKRVRQFCEEWTVKNKISPQTASADDARRLMHDLRYNAPQDIMDFNKSIWMRGMMTNLYWLRPTE